VTLAPGVAVPEGPGLPLWRSLVDSFMGEVKSCLPPPRSSVLSPGASGCLVP